MECFFVDGKKQSFADIILKYKKSGDTCLVGSFGFGTKQVKKLLANFKKTVLLADSSHSQLNSNAYFQVCRLAESSDNFVFKQTKTHAKFAIVDDEVFIMTSANLSQNQRLEIYVIEDVAKVNGLDEIKKVVGMPTLVMCGDKNKESEFDIDIDIDIDFEIFEVDYDYLSRL
jgi:hypothetical protein